MTAAADRDYAEKARAFQSLHTAGSLFVLPNPWDRGSAKLLTSLGFKALATTSAGYAFSRGLGDRIGETDRATALVHAREIVAATPLPVSADLENGFGERPEAVAETVRQAAAAGLVGCTIEDTSGDPARPIYDRALAVERIIAGVEAAAALQHPFMLTARAENFLHGRPDLDDTLARLQAYEAAGAPVVYAPGLPDLDAVRAVCASVSVPVNVVAGIGLQGVGVAELERCGVRRLSTGSALARVAYGAALRAAGALLDDGDTASLTAAVSFAEIEQRLGADG